MSFLIMNTLKKVAPSVIKESFGLDIATLLCIFTVEKKRTKKKNISGPRWKRTMENSYSYYGYGLISKNCNVVKHTHKVIYI